MTTYSDVFGGSTVPPSQDKLNQVSLTANATMYWPYEYSGTGISAADLIEITTDTTRTVTLPAASSAGKGAGFVLRNTGAYTVTLLDGAGGGLTTLAAGVAKYFYVDNNSTVAGAWSIVTWGTGTSAADASTLAGVGLVALSGALATGVEVVESSGALAVTSSHRSKLLVNTGGTVTFTLALAADLGEEFYCTFRNSGSGNLTVATTSSQTLDGGTSLTIAPGETATVVRNGNAFYSFGQGRDVAFAFTQLNITLTGATRTVTTANAANKMLNFTGSPGTNVTVTLPSFSSIYYVYNNLTTANGITFTTGSGSSTLVPQGQRAILFVDSVNVVSAQTPAATSAINFGDGTALAPSVTFASETNLGIYRPGVGTIGVSVAGTSIGTFAATGWTGSCSGISPTKIGYLTDVTSNIQAQINGKQNTNTDLTAVAGLASNGVAVRTGTGTWTTRSITAGTGITVTNGDGVLGVPTIAVTASTYQPLNANLTAIAGLDASAGLLEQTGTNTFAKRAISTDIKAFLNAADKATALTALGGLLNGINPQAAAYTVGAADRGKLIDCTTGTWALKFDSVTLGANFAFAVRNSGTGTITLTALRGDPTTALIDGAATATLNAGESCLIFCDGTNFETVGRRSPVISMVRLNTANGYGLTNTVIRRFLNVVINQGADITYADSASLGASFTINTPGIYAISYSDSFNAAGNLGVSLNSTQLTTSILSINVADKLTGSDSAGANGLGFCSWTGYLTAGSVVRAHCGGAPDGSELATFTISRAN